MRFYLFLSVVASLCSALVIPDQETLAAISKAYLRLHGHGYSQPVSTGADSHDDEPDTVSWWRVVSAITRDRRGSATNLVLSLLGLDSRLDGAVEVSQYRDPAADGANDDRGGGGDDGGDDDGDGGDDERPDYCYRTGPGERPGYGQPFTECDHRACPPEVFCPEDHTIWELINESAKTSRLANLMKNTDYLVNVLNSTTANYTLFAPTNSALERLLDEEPLTELLKQIEHYHVIPGLFNTNKRRRHQTLRTALNESSLGKNMPQRVVVRKRQNALLLNGMSRIVAGDISAKNGIMHQINIPLLPPPNTSAIIDLLPAHLSTFAHGLERTKLTTHFWKGNRVGGTTFAPTNAAFERLGPLATAFLLLPQGEQCLRSLLQYHIVLNQTLYSDALYSKGGVFEFGGIESSASVHVGLLTVLKGHALDIDVARRGPGVEIRVNGFVRVVGLDLLASDGVLHVLNEVLVPPRKIGGKVKRDNGVDRIGVELLKQRLGGCVEDTSARMERV
ncbi:hypothetical protein N7448_007688 [Penicillium atrosanguineum]|nr:hypothetical protein N7448_007688 [Penicillium atrosanguineum]